MPGTISCCSAAPYSMSNSRGRPAAGRRVWNGRPNPALLLGPISLSCATLSLFTSLHVRVSDCNWSGLYRCVHPSPSPAMYLLTVALRAVRLLPNTSYDAPTRGATSNQLGRFCCASKCRAGAKRPATTSCSSMEALKYSRRTPAFSVKRFSVHESWAKTPRSALRVSCVRAGVL